MSDNAPAVSPAILPAPDRGCWVGLCILSDLEGSEQQSRKGCPGPGTRDGISTLHSPKRGSSHSWSRHLRNGFVCPQGPRKKGWLGAISRMRQGLELYVAGDDVELLIILQGKGIKGVTVTPGLCSTGH